MTEETLLLTWTTVNAYMTEEYRRSVVESALLHLHEVSGDLGLFARKAMSHINIPGFRSVDRAPVGRAEEPVLEEMQWDDDVATAVICLWAAAKEDLLDTLRSTGLGVRERESSARIVAAPLP